MASVDGGAKLRKSVQSVKMKIPADYQISAGICCLWMRNCAKVR
nr:MAG TPA: hypothetical protein [Caudoviricetes sp.]